MARELFVREFIGADGALWPLIDTCGQVREVVAGDVRPGCFEPVRYVPEDTANTRAALESIVIKLHKLAGMRMSHEAAEEMRNILGTLGVALKD